MRRVMRTLVAIALAAACAPLPGQSGNTGVVPILLGNPIKPGLQAGFRTQAYDVADVYKANVSVNGPGMASPVNATGNPIALPNGQSATSVQVVVPTGNNRVITATGLDSSGGALPSWITVKGVTNVASGVNTAVPVNWTTTPTARVIEALMTANSPYAATVNIAQLQSLVDQITVPVAGPPTTYTVHPSRIDATVLANAIIANSGAVPGSPPPGSTIAAGTISGTVSGLVLNQTATVVANDPASTPVTTATNGSYTISGVTPENGITVKATTFFTDDATTTTSVAAGGTGTANTSLSAMHYISNSLYSDGASINNKVLRWTRMPINVLVITPTNAAAIGWVPDHQTAFNEALSRWTSQLGDLISFNVTTTADADPSLAAKKTATDIYVEWIQQFGSVASPDGKLGVTNTGWSYCGACTPNATNLSAGIQLATQYYAISTPVTYLPQPDYAYRAVAIHEMGHALGSVGNPSSNGHSSDPFDLMYFSTDANWPVNLIPTANDFKTFRLLYSTPANITRLP